LQSTHRQHWPVAKEEDITSSPAIAETARRKSYIDSQNFEVGFLSHPFEETQMLHVYAVGRNVVDFL